jgi:aryl-phospho-beta-D-glucosidase BglC (GH1 family)
MGLEYGTGSSSPDQCRFGWGGEDAGGFSAKEFDNIASWGFNVVRLPVSWENLEPTPPTLSSDGTWAHQWNTAYLSEIDYFVNQFGQRHIAVILDLHQLDLSPAFQQAPGGVHGMFCEGWGEPTWLYPGTTLPTTGSDLATAICNFFNDKSMVGSSAPAPVEGLAAAEHMLASRYDSNPTVVGMDLFNEPWFARSCAPTRTADDLLMNFDAKISKSVSAANPHLLIVFEEPPRNLMPQLN